MLLKKAAEPKKEVSEENPYDWPESYYMEIEPLKRKELLDARIASGDGSGKNLLRRELWELRYQPQKKGEYKDNFMLWLLELILMSRQMDRTFGKKSQRKQAAKALEIFCIDRTEYFGDDLIAEELKHLLLSYGVLCMEDRSYGSVVLGFGKMKQSNLERKIAAEYETVGVKLPEYLEMTEEFSMFSEAVRAAGRHLGL